MAQNPNTPVVVQTGGNSGMGAMVVALVFAAVLIVALMWWRPWEVATQPMLPEVPTDINIRGDINVNPPITTAP